MWLLQQRSVGLQAADGQRADERRECHGEITRETDTRIALVCRVLVCGEVELQIPAMAPDAAAAARQSAASSARAEPSAAAGRRFWCTTAASGLLGDDGACGGEWVESCGGRGRRGRSGLVGDERERL